MAVSSPRWSAVVFDLDGTLVDSIDLIVQSYQYATQTVLGHTLPESTVRSWIGRPLLETMQEISAAHADELFQVYSDWGAEQAPNLIRGFDGIPDLLADLRAAQLPVAVATSKRAQTCRAAVELCGLADLIGVYVTLEDTNEHKPQPAPLLLAVERLGAVPGRSVYVGDAVVDIRAARAAGMSSIAVPWGAGSAQALAAADPDATAVDVADLRRLLLGATG